MNADHRTASDRLKCKLGILDDMRVLDLLECVYNQELSDRDTVTTELEELFGDWLGMGMCSI